MISRTVVAMSNNIYWSGNDSFPLIPVMKKVKASIYYYKERLSIGLRKVAYCVFGNSWSTGHQVPPRYKFLDT